MMDGENKRLFEEAVTEIVRLIPPGRATSYGAIARAAGYSDLSRMVGRFMANLPPGHALPAHRVVNSQGRLTARAAFGPGREFEDLLAAEGITVSNNTIKNWRRVFWDPISEIGMPG